MLNETILLRFLNGFWWFVFVFMRREGILWIDWQNTSDHISSLLVFSCHSCHKKLNVIVRSRPDLLYGQINPISSCIFFIKNSSWNWIINAVCETWILHFFIFQCFQTFNSTKYSSFFIIFIFESSSFSCITEFSVSSEGNLV